MIDIQKSFLPKNNMNSMKDMETDFRAKNKMSNMKECKQMLELKII